MSDQFWHCKEQRARIQPWFLLSHGLRGREALEVCGPDKTFYNWFVRWSKMGIFDRVFATLIAENGPPDRLMIEATHLKPHRTICSLIKGACARRYWTHKGWSKQHQVHPAF